MPLVAGFEDLGPDRLLAGAGDLAPDTLLDGIRMVNFSRGGAGVLSTVGVLAGGLDDDRPRRDVLRAFSSASTGSAGGAAVLGALYSGPVTVGRKKVRTRR